MRELTADTFHPAMAETECIACILHRGDLDGADGAWFQDTGDAGDFTWTHIDLDGAPDIAAMFGVEGPKPWLMLMRQTVVLYCQPLSSGSTDAVRATLDQAAKLDMSRVRNKVAEERLGKDALFNRRACPTTWRTR